MDSNGKPIILNDYLNARKAAALQGQVYNPILGFATVRNVPALGKYPVLSFLWRRQPARGGGVESEVCFRHPWKTVR